MGTYEAVYATCTAICTVLEQSRSGVLYGPDVEAVTCRVITTGDFESDVPLAGEVVLFLYRVEINRVQRTLPPRPREDGHREKRHLPLDLHFLLIPRAGTAETQQVILGWMMRVLEDHPSIPATVLNSAREGVFDPEEHVEVVFESLSTEEILRLWDQVPADFSLSVPYSARVVRIESPVLEEEGPPVLRRDLDFGEVER
ncbi:MAG: DUF4255 domain-containing protein [Candidatus Promineifilaceae bacterium]|nr:DUF4255 domain-containing protein [Candidatus Promineifilaceae bacterium]